jgi:Spy/CpxP family protein refolding chaperone
MRKRTLTVAVAAAFVLIAGVASSQAPRQPGETPGYGMGPDMMGGPGMMGGSGPRGGYGPGYGAGGGRGYGPGYGMGPGMMGGNGLGMMNLRQLGLSDEQRAQVNKIHDELRRKNWDVLGKTQDEAARLRDLYAAEKFDRAAMTAAYKRLGDLRQVRVENMLEAYEKVDAVLTPEQRKTLRRSQGDWDVE